MRSFHITWDEVNWISISWDMKKQSLAEYYLPTEWGQRGTKSRALSQPYKTRFHASIDVMFMFCEHNFLIDWNAPGFLSEHCKSISLVHTVTKPIDFLHLLVHLELFRISRITVILLIDQFWLFQNYQSKLKNQIVFNFLCGFCLVILFLYCIS